MKKLRIITAHMESNLPQYILWIGRLVFAVLFAFAFLFYKERMILYDASFVSFRIIDSKWFDFELGRWGAALSQFIPLLIVKMGGSLKLFLVIYSLSFILVEYLIFELMYFLYKDFKALIVLVLFLCLVFRVAFYYAAIDIQIGVVVSILLWSFVVNSSLITGKILGKAAYYLIAFGLIYTTSYFHQLVIIPILFLLTYQLIADSTRRVNILIILFMAIAWYYLRIYVFTYSEYENQKILTIEMFKSLLKRITELPGLKFYIDFSINEIWPMWIALILTSVLLISKKKVLQALFIVICCIGFTAFNIVEYYLGTSQLFYENYFIITGLFVGVGFAFVTINPDTRRKLHVFLILVFVGLLGHGLCGIYKAHYRLTERLNYEERLISHGRKFSNSKFLIGTANMPNGLFYGEGDWPFPFETLLLSSLVHPDSAITFFHVSKMSEMDSLMNDPNIFLGPRWAVTWFWANGMNKKFFNLRPGGYVKLTTPQCDTLFNEADFNNTNVFIQPVNPVWESTNDTLSFVPIIIKNKTGKKLNAQPCFGDKTISVILSYHIFDMNRNSIVYEGLRTPLALDITDEIKQVILVNTKLKKGEYYVEIDLLTENKRWWGINAGFTLKVR